MRNDTRNLERIVKGFANRHRLAILELLLKKPERSVEEIADTLKLEYNNASDHIRKLAIAGLLLKRYQSIEVRHRLTERGEAVLAFCRSLV